jgi:hypothetical protein
MNCSDLRKYWCSKYSNRFGVLYKSDKISIELVWLKRLNEKYGSYTVLNAIDKFIDNSNIKISTILYFANPKYFESKFKLQNGLYNISKYIRFLPFFTENVPRIKSLIEEYRICSHEMSTDYDLIRKQEILKELENLTKDYFERIQ